MVFCNFICDEVALNLETTGGYASYLNGKAECPNRTIAEWVRASLINVNSPAKDWCYAAEHASDLYRVTLHSNVKMPPFQAWYGEHHIYRYILIWGCRMVVPNHGMNKSGTAPPFDAFMVTPKVSLFSDGVSTPHITSNMPMGYVFWKLTHSIRSLLQDNNSSGRIPRTRTVMSYVPT
jgi:hypothetical protein